LIKELLAAEDTKRQPAEEQEESTDSEENANLKQNSTVLPSLTRMQDATVLGKLDTTVSSTKLINIEELFSEFLIANLHQESFAQKNKLKTNSNNVSREDKAPANQFVKKKADWHVTTKLTDLATKTNTKSVLQNGRKTTVDTELKLNVEKIKIVCPKD